MELPEQDRFSAVSSVPLLQGEKSTSDISAPDVLLSFIVGQKPPKYPPLEYSSSLLFSKMTNFHHVVVVACWITELVVFLQTGFKSYPVLTDIDLVITFER